MTMALDNEVNDDTPRNKRQEVTSVSDLLENAQALAGQIDRLLSHVGRNIAESDSFRVRLARAHTLSLLDSLSELLSPPRSSSYPPVRSCAPLDDEEKSTPLRRPNSWR